MASQRYGSWQSSKLRQTPTRTRTKPTYSSPTNGAVESTIGPLTGQVGTLRGQLEMMHGLTLNPNMCVWPLVARHSSWSLNKFSVHVGEEAFDSEWKRDLCVVGQKILLQEAESYTGAMVMGGRRSKAVAVWHRGLWLGRGEQTTSILLELSLNFSSRETCVDCLLNNVAQRTSVTTNSRNRSATITTRTTGAVRSRGHRSFCTILEPVLFSAAPDPNVREESHLKSTQLVDESLDATMQIRAKKARIAGLTVEQSSRWTKTC